MKRPYFHLDAFTSEVFRGNPAGVVLLDRWPDAAVMQAVAVENGLSATALFVPDETPRRIRWFTPKVELELCGHGTLAAGFICFDRLNPDAIEVEFLSGRGPLRVRRDGERLALDFPAIPATPCDPPAGLVEALGIRPRETLKAKDLLVVLDQEKDVRALKPDIGALARIDARGIIVTAPGSGSDYVSRFFTPSVGIAEDPATGSSHCTLVPYWAARLGRTALHDLQVSARGGEFWCEMAGDRVTIAGHATLYLEGTIRIG